VSWYVIAKCAVLKAWFDELLELNFVQATQNPLQTTIWITKFSVKEQWEVYELPRTHRVLYFATHTGCIQKQTCRICDAEQWEVYKLPRTHRGLYFATHTGCIQKQTCRICDAEQWKSKKTFEVFITSSDLKKSFTDMFL
jgi:hypothetical protein